MIDIPMNLKNKKILKYIIKSLNYIFNFIFLTSPKYPPKSLYNELDDMTGISPIYLYDMSL